ncbi:MAG: type III-B CRISPR module RAMP protein Cmr6 [Oligosphaeraceae bacterium]
MNTATTEIVNLLRPDFSQCESPSLRLEKFVVCGGSQDQRAVEVKRVVGCHQKYSKGVSSRRLRHPQGRSFTLELGGNLMVNQSGGILENAGLCLDHFRGWPQIPGSSLKGVASHAAYHEWCDSHDHDLAERIFAVFGYPTGHHDLDDTYSEHPVMAGQVSFLPAVPSGTPTLTADICTSHHPKYYQGKLQTAVDSEEPIPLVFPAVKAGTAFVFTLIPLRQAKSAVLDDAQRWLRHALTHDGVGAKTAAGYGWFKEAATKEAKPAGPSKEELNRQQAKQEQDAKEKADKEKQLQAAREMRAKEDEDRKQLANQPFSKFANDSMKKLSQGVSAIFKANGGQFSPERRQELLGVIAANGKVKNKELLDSCKSLMKWFGDSHELLEELLDKRNFTPKERQEFQNKAEKVRQELQGK